VLVASGALLTPRSLIVGHKDALHPIAELREIALWFAAQHAMNKRVRVLFKVRGLARANLHLAMPFRGIIHER
jgi:hypothetical protein